MTRQQALIIQALQNDVLERRVYDRRGIIAQRKARQAKRQRRESLAQFTETAAVVVSLGFVVSIWAFVAIAIVGAQ